MAADLFLGFDASNYTSSLALVDAEGTIRFNGKIPLPVKAGERGLRQSDAVFQHVKNYPLLLEQVRPFIGQDRILGVGVSESPRNAPDSYMPCFLAGIEAATAFAAGAGIHLFRFSHQEGHLMAAAHGSGAGEDLFLRPYLGFHVSGGTTEMLFCRPNGSRLDIRCIGGSSDLHAGQLIDRIGVRMGLPFPAGPAMEEAARVFAESGAEPPRGRDCAAGLVCHLSGLENLAAAEWEKSGDRGRTACFVLSSLALTLRSLLRNGRAAYGNLLALFSGGVMSNRYLQSELGQCGETRFAPPALSADNAVGIALLAARSYRTKAEAKE